MRWKLREPFCGLSHLGGAVFSFIGLVALWSAAAGKPAHLLAYTIYGGSLVLVYVASTLYHSLPVSPRAVARLLLLDQVAIYVVIAGTYTPICVLALPDACGRPLLAAVWSIAVVGIVVRCAWKTARAWLPYSLYVVMGWLAVVALTPMARALSPAGLAWLVAGGLFYTGGVVLLALGWPRRWLGRLGPHDFWHLMVLAGSACHFVVIWNFIAQA